MYYTSISWYINDTSPIVYCSCSWWICCKWMQMDCSDLWLRLTGMMICSKEQWFAMKNDHTSIHQLTFDQSVYLYICDTQNNCYVVDSTIWNHQIFLEGGIIPVNIHHRRCQCSAPNMLVPRRVGLETPLTHWINLTATIQGSFVNKKSIFLAILNCGTLSKVGDFPRQAVARRSIAPSSTTCSWPSVPLPLWSSTYGCEKRGSTGCRLRMGRCQHGDGTGWYEDIKTTVLEIKNYMLLVYKKITGKFGYWYYPLNNHLHSIIC